MVTLLARHRYQFEQPLLERLQTDLDWAQDRETPVRSGRAMDSREHLGVVGDEVAVVPVAAEDRFHFVQSVRDFALTTA